MCHLVNQLCRLTSCPGSTAPLTHATRTQKTHETANRNSLRRSPSSTLYHLWLRPFNPTQKIVSLCLSSESQRWYCHGQVSVLATALVSVSAKSPSAVNCACYYISTCLSTLKQTYKVHGFVHRFRNETTRSKRSSKRSSFDLLFKYLRHTVCHNFIRITVRQ